MWHELRTVFDTLSEDSSTRAIVLSGAGEKAFSAGLDVASASIEGSFFNPRPEDVADGARYATRVRRFALQFQDCISSIERCEKREPPSVKASPRPLAWNVYRLAHKTT